MKKHALSIVLTLALLLGLLPVAAMAQNKAAYIGGTGYDTLAEAIAAAAGETVIELADGTHTMPLSVTDKNITITGSENAVVEMLGDQYANNSTIAFEGVTVKFGTASYRGLKHSTKVTYTDCIHIGTQFLYAPTVAFTNCTFNITGDAYAVWTYGASDVTFAGCTFNTDGKAILVYTEAAHTATINVNDCTFNAATNRGKAAVEVGQSAYGNKANYTLNISDSTAEDNFVANNSTSNLWGNKNDIPLDDLVCEVTQTPAVYGGPVMNQNKITKTEGGSVKTSPIAASEGAAITIYPFADEGYEMTSVTVTGKNGQAVELTQNSAGRWTYRIPLGGVTVTPTFTAK